MASQILVVVGAIEWLWVAMREERGLCRDNGEWKRGEKENAREKWGGEG